MNASGCKINNMLPPEKLASLYKSIDIARKTAVVVLFAFIVVSMGLQIVLRNLQWTDEILRYVNIWVVFLGAGLAVKHSEHLQMTFISDKLFGPKATPLLRTIRLIVVILALSAIAVAGIDKTIRSAGSQAQMVEISIAWFYLAIPVGCLLMAMDYLLILLYGRHPFVDHTPTMEDPAC